MEHFEKTPQTRSEDKSKNSTFKNSFSRRNFLFGSAAALGATALGTVEAKANGLQGLLSMISPENRNQSVEAIKAYGDFLRKNRTALEGSSALRQLVFDLITPQGGIPPTEWNRLKHTEFDHENLMRRNGTWPSVQFGYGKNGKGPILQWSQDMGAGHEVLANYGNSFFVNNIFVMNNHEHSLFLRPSSYSEALAEGLDIQAIACDDMNLNDALKNKINGSELTFDLRKATTDLHGELIHIPSIHEQRGDPADKTEITSGVAVKITDAFLYDQQKGNDSFFSKETTAKYGESLKRSYMCVVPSLDTNGDGVSNGDDLGGISGSPIFSDADCADGSLTPMGIVWGSGVVYDQKRNLSYSVVYFFGPDVLSEMISKVDTVLSGNMDETQFPQKRPLTIKVQEALASQGYTVAVDGVYGGATQQAVFAFQKKVFDVDTLRSTILLGDVDRRTWGALFPDEAHVNKLEMYASLSS